MSSVEEPGLSQWIPHSISKESEHNIVPPGLQAESGHQLPSLSDPRQGPSFQLNFLPCAPALWLALRPGGRNLGRDHHPWSSWALDKHQETRVGVGVNGALA